MEMENKIEQMSNYENQRSLKFMLQFTYKVFFFHLNLLYKYLQ